MTVFIVLHLFTWVHIITMNIGAAVAAADTGEGSNGVSVAVTVTDEKWGETSLRDNRLPDKLFRQSVNKIWYGMLHSHVCTLWKKVNIVYYECYYALLSNCGVL